MGPTEPDKANSAAKATGITRPITAQPATALSPNEEMAPVTKALPTGVAICVSTEGTPMAKNGLKVWLRTLALGHSYSRCTRKTPCSPIATMTSRARHVEIAAPSRPQPKPKISKGSSTAVATPAPRVTNIARRASPSDRSNALKQIPRPRMGVEGSTMRVKRKASSAVVPVAPSKFRK